MPFESFTQTESQEEPPSHAQSSLEKAGSAAGGERERFAWNDIIVPEADLRIAERVIIQAGFACETKVIPESGQYLDNDERKQAIDECVLSITHRHDKTPVDREILKTIIAALRENDRHLVVRVARLAPGERFG